jgi:hypothetical protein
MIVPGRILVIDDTPDEVSELIETLRKDGENVYYGQSLPEDKILENVRLLVVDLFLDPDDEDNSYSMVSGIIKKTSLTSGYVVVALWTKAAKNDKSDDQIVKRLMETLKDFNGVILQPFGKDGISQTELFDRLKRIVGSNPQCSLLLEIEKAVETARDGTVSEILNAGSIPLVLRVLKEEVGEEAVNRQMIELYLKILARHLSVSPEISTCITALTNKPANIDHEKFGRIYNLQSYYETLPGERVWTGDILEKEGKYAIIVTPSCDFAQNKVRPLEYIKTINALRINHKDLLSKNKTKEIGDQIKVKSDKKEKLPNAILKGESLQKRFYVLKYLKDQNGDLYHLVLDFQQVSKIQFKETKTLLETAEGWKPIFRIDTPVISDLLHDYSSYSSRIGIQSIPNEVVEDIVKKIVDDTAKKEGSKCGESNLSSI